MGGVPKGKRGARDRTQPPLQKEAEAGPRAFVTHLDRAHRLDSQQSKNDAITPQAGKNVMRLFPKLSRETARAQ